MVLDVFKQVVKQGRQLRLQSFNNYRVKYGMTRYKNFLELTGDAALAEELEQIYGDVDALEFYPGQHPIVSNISSSCNARIKLISQLEIQDGRLNLIGQ